MEGRILNFNVHGDSNGKLVALEKNVGVPFEIKRVYYIWDTQSDIIRGKHAHKNLQQVVICLSGSCDFILDDGKERKTFHLDDPSKGLYLSNCVWREFTNFSEDCVLMVLASEYYDEADYIRNYGDFQRLIVRGGGV